MSLVNGAEAAIYPCLKDRVILVTGGGSGIGASIVERFCKQGSRVSFIDVDEKIQDTFARSIQQLQLKQRRERLG